MIPCQWFLTFEGSGRGRDYPFRTKVTNLHLGGTWNGKDAAFMSSQNLHCSEHHISDVTLLEHTFSGACAFLRSYTITTGELSSSVDVTGLVAYLGVRGAGRVYNKHNSHCWDAMQNHLCPSYHLHQWCQPDLLRHTPGPLLHAYCADPKWQCTLYCWMTQGRAAPVDSMIWMWSHLVLTSM